MTGITALRPPRSSVTSAYLNHLSRKKQQSSSAPPRNDARRERSASFPGPLDKTDMTAVSSAGEAANASRPPNLFYSESSGTAATCASGSSGENSRSSERTDGSVRGRYNTEDDSNAWDLQRHLSTALVLVEQNPQQSQHDYQYQEDSPDLLLDRLMMVQADLGSYELGSFDAYPGTPPDFEEEQELDDDDSLCALNRLLEETSRRWEQNTLLTHREFCRLPNCRICLSQSEGIIAQQQAEIQALRAKLINQQHHSAEYHSGLQYQEHKLQQQGPAQLPLHHEPNNYDYHHDAHQEDPDANYLPIEQIEVYHGDDDCNVSVTSGLTNLYPDHQSITPDNNHSLQRPDAESTSASVTGASTPPLPSHHASSRVRGHAVSLTAADGSVRQAIYSGPLLRGKPHGVGVLKFIESGDIYLGDLQNGCMHGHGTYTFKDSKKNRNRRSQVLKGTFQNNVFTGYASPDIVGPSLSSDSL